MQLTTPPPPPTLGSVAAESSARVRKAVLAGCGGIARQWLKAAAALDDVEVVGLCDVRPQQMAELAAAHGLGAVSTGERLAEVIAASGADTVFDCTVPGAHHDITVAALAAGCDVLGEKPMAETMGDAQAMVRTAADAGKSYAVIQNQRYTPQIVAYRRALQNPALGGLTGLHADFFVGAHFDGFRTEMRHVLLLDMAIHSFDQARFLTGADPVAVTAIDWNPRGSWFGHGGNAVAVFEMTGGLVFSYRGSWCSEGQHTSWECAWRGTGQRGTVSWDGGDQIAGERTAGPAAGGTSLVHTTEPLHPPGPVDLEHTGHAGVMREFLDCLASGDTPQTYCSDNIKSLAMVLGAVESAETGRRVEIGAQDPRLAGSAGKR